MSGKKNVEVKAKIVRLLIDALGMEVNAILQYQSFALNAKLGDYRSEKVAELFNELATDETGDLKKFSEWLSNLGATIKTGLPVDILVTDDATKMLQHAIHLEKTGIRKYKEIIEAIKEDPDSIEFDSYGLFHLVNHIIIDEEEHLRKISRLLP